MGSLIPLFCTSGDVSSGFQSYRGSLMHLWCDTCQLLGKTSERLLDEEFIIIKRVKLLFHLFINPPSVIKQTNYIRTLYSKMSLRLYKLFQWGGHVTYFLDLLLVSVISGMWLFTYHSDIFLQIHTRREGQAQPVCLAALRIRTQKLYRDETGPQWTQSIHLLHPQELQVTKRN